MRPFRKTLGPYAAASANNIALSQTPAGAGAITLNGSAVSGGFATLDTERNVLITSAADDSGRIFTIRGRDSDNKYVYERIAGANATTRRSERIYLYVDSIEVDGGTAGAITVGTTATNTSNWIPCNVHANPPNISAGVDVVSGTLTYSIVGTFDELYKRESAGAVVTQAGPADLTGKSADAVDTIVDNFTGVRLEFTAYTSGSVTLTIAQAGLAGN